MRRAKIICTIGPASSDEKTLGELIEAGMDVARLNFSHGSHEEHLETIKRIRGLSDTVAVMQDLQGPKIRVGEISTGETMLLKDAEVVLVSGERESEKGTIPITYPQLAADVNPGDNIYLSDGTIHIEVLDVAGGAIRCRVVHGGLLKSKKGVNLPGVDISSPALTAKDREDLEFGLEAGVDYVALSFVRSPDEVREIKRLIRDADSLAKVVSKIEKQEALDSIEDILDETDAVMIARGDLGVEIPAEEVPIVQKSLIRSCLKRGKPVITATQMLESMVAAERPTRAEASDVANAVIDGSDAVMLSEETATGRYPVEAVRVMGRIIERAEEYITAGKGRETYERTVFADESVDFADAVCSGVAAVVRDVEATAVAVLTHTGQTALLVARRRIEVPVIALTEFLPVIRQMALVWGVRAIPVESIEDTEAIFATVREKMREAGFTGKIVITAGIPTKKRRPSNTVHVVDI